MKVLYELSAVKVQEVYIRLVVSSSSSSSPSFAQTSRPISSFSQMRAVRLKLSAPPPVGVGGGGRAMGPARYFCLRRLI